MILKTKYSMIQDLENNQIIDSLIQIFKPPKNANILYAIKFLSRFVCTCAILMNLPHTH